MRRSPKALERERKIEALIGAANQAQGLSPAERQLREIIEDPAFHSGRPSSRLRCKPPSANPSMVHTPESDGEVYAKGLARVRRLQRERHELLFPRVLRELFTEIARAGVGGGPFLAEAIELPDPISKRRLCINPDGAGYIVDSPARARFEELYALLEGLDLTRIRECGSCKQLFWARRKDQCACSKPCANRYRAARFYYRAKQGGLGQTASTAPTGKPRHRAGASARSQSSKVPKPRR